LEEEKSVSAFMFSDVSKIDIFLLELYFYGVKENKELMNNLSSYHFWSCWKSKILRIFSFLL
jgi:hypothetical protein